MLMTVWSLLEECVSQLAEPFRRSEIVSWFRRHHPEVNEATLAAHIQAATVNATNRAQNNLLGTRPPLLRRVDHGLYVRAAQNPGPCAGRKLGYRFWPGLSCGGPVLVEQSAQTLSASNRVDPGENRDNVRFVFGGTQKHSVALVAAPGVVMGDVDVEHVV